MKSDNRKERDHILDVEHLSMHFTTKKRGKTSVVKAVDDVSFYVERGETFGAGGGIRLRKDHHRPHHHPSVRSHQRDRVL